MYLGVWLKCGEVVLDVVELGIEPADKFLFRTGGDGDTFDNFCVMNDAASWIISWLINLDGMDPVIADLFTEEFPEVLLGQLIWELLPEDNVGDVLWKTIVSSFTFGSQVLSERFA